MTEILKVFKNYILHIIIITIFLLINAISSLALPDHMSNMINIGLQQKGLEIPIPIVIREETFKKFIDLIDDNSIIMNNYTLIEQGNENFLDLYPALSYTNVYVLNKIDNDTKNLISSHFLKILSEVYKTHNPNNVNNFSKKELNKLAIMFINKEHEAIGLNQITLQNKFIIKSGSIMLIIALIGMAASIIVSLIASIVSSNLAKELRKKIFEKVMSFSNYELDKFSTSSLITRSTNDINQIQSFVLLFLRMVLYAIVMGIGGIIKVSKSDTGMGYIIVISIIILMIIVIALFIFITPKFSILQKLQDKLNLISRESLTGIFVIRAFSNQNEEEKKFDKTNIDITKINLFINKTMGLMLPAIMLVFNYTTIAIIWIGSKYVDSGSIQVGDIMAFIEYSASIIVAFLMLSMISIILPRAIVSAKRINEILITNPSIKDPENPEKFKKNIGKIEFKNVAFKYPNSEEYILKNLNFKVIPGETTALIGSTGSGKSSIFNLILRFYDVTEGEIYIDGINIKNAALNDIREKIAYIPQKALLFSGTIESNLKFSNENNISEDTIIEAINIAQANDFINDKKEKLNHPVSQGGSNLSGGQKQRLSIARAITKNAKIYMFDDSFSALDYKTDKALRNELNKKMKEKTFLIISQRISTIKNANQIIVLDKGKIVGIGVHDHLIKNCDVYKEIAKSQLR